MGFCLLTHTHTPTPWWFGVKKARIQDSAIDVGGCHCTTAGGNRLVFYIYCDGIRKRNLSKHLIFDVRDDIAYMVCQIFGLCFHGVDGTNGERVGGTIWRGGVAWIKKEKQEKSHQEERASSIRTVCYSSVRRIAEIVCAGNLMQPTNGILCSFFYILLKTKVCAQSNMFERNAIKW